MESVRMLIMCQLSDAQHLMRAGNIEDANWLINAAKVMLEELDDKRVDFDEMNSKVKDILGER